MDYTDPRYLAGSDLLRSKAERIAKKANHKEAQLLDTSLVKTLDEFDAMYPEATAAQQQQFLNSIRYDNASLAADIGTAMDISFFDNVPMMANTAAGLITGDQQYFDNALAQQQEAQVKRDRYSQGTQQDIRDTEVLSQQRAERLDAEGLEGFERGLQEFGGATWDFFSNPSAAITMAAENSDSLVTMPVGGAVVGGVVKQAAKRKVKREIKELLGKDAYKTKEGKDLLKRALASKQGEREAAARTGAVVFGDAYTGYAEGSSNALGTYNEIMELDQEVLDQSEDYLSLRERNPDMTADEARLKLATTQGRKTAVQSGAAAVAIGRGTGATATMTSALRKNKKGTGIAGTQLLKDDTKDSVLKGAAKMGGKEYTEEVLQSGAGSTLSNMNVKEVDPNKEVLDGVFEDAAAGGLSGAISGATTGVATKIVPKTIEKVIGGVGKAATKAQDLVSKGKGKGKGKVEGEGEESEAPTSAYRKQQAKDYSKFSKPSDWTNEIKHVSANSELSGEDKQGSIAAIDEQLQKAYKNKNITKEEFDSLHRYAFGKYQEAEKQSAAQNKANAEALKQGKKPEPVSKVSAPVLTNGARKSIAKIQALMKSEGIKFSEARKRVVTDQGIDAEITEFVDYHGQAKKNKGTKQAGSAPLTERDQVASALRYFLTAEGVEDNELATKLAGSKHTTAGEQAIIKALQSHANLRAEIKNRETVARQIADSDDDQYLGLKQYMQLVPTAIHRNDVDETGELLSQLHSLKRTHANKAKTGKYIVDGVERDFSKDPEMMQRFKDESAAITMAYDHLEVMAKEQFADLDPKKNSSSQLKDDMAAQVNAANTSEASYTVPPANREKIVKQALNLLLNPASAGRVGTESALKSNRLKLNNTYGVNATKIKEWNQAYNTIDTLSKKPTLTKDDKKALSQARKSLNEAYTILADNYGSTTSLQQALNEQVENTVDIDAAFDGAYQKDAPLSEGQTKYGHRSIKKINKLTSSDSVASHNDRLTIAKQYLRDHPDLFTTQQSDDLEAMSPMSELSDNPVETYNALADIMNNVAIPYTDIPVNDDTGVTGTSPENRVFLNVLEKLVYTDKARQNIQLIPDLVGLAQTEENLIEKLTDKNSDIYKHLTRNLDAESLDRVRDFVDFYGSMSSAIDATAIPLSKVPEKDRASYAKNFVLNEYFDKDGKLPAPIKLAMTMAAADYLLGNAGKSLHNLDKDIAKILGKPETYLPTSKERYLFRKGNVQTLVQEQLGTFVTRMMGMEGIDQGDINYIKQFRTNIGLAIVAAMTDESNNRHPIFKLRRVVMDNKTGLATRELEYGDKYDVTSNERAINLLVANAAPDQDQVAGQPTVFIAKTEKAIAAAGDNDLMRDFFGVETNHVPVYFDDDEIPNQDNVPWVSAKQKEAVRKQNADEHTPDEMFLTVRGLLDQDYRDALVDEVFPEEEEHISNREINKARREAVARTNAGLDKIMSQFRERGAKTIHFRNRANRSNKRFDQGSSDGSPQSSKLVRHAIKLTSQRVDLNMRNKKHKFAFMLATTEALGIEIESGINLNASTDKMMDAVVSKAFDKILNDKVLMAGINTIADGSMNKDLIQAALGKGGEKAHKLEGLIAMADYVNRKDGKFTTFIGKENDGITNGIAIGLMQLANAASYAEYVKALSRTGIYTGQFSNSVGYGEQYAQDGNKDSYQEFGGVMTTKVQNPLDNPFSDYSVLPQVELAHEEYKGFMSYEQMMAMQKKQITVPKSDDTEGSTSRMSSREQPRNSKRYVHTVNITLKEHKTISQSVQYFLNQKVVEEGKVVRLKDVVANISRKFAKDPLMIFNYGAMMKSLKQSVADSVVRGIAEALRQANKLEGVARDDAIAEITDAVNGLTPFAGQKMDFAVDDNILDTDLNPYASWARMAVGFTYGPAMEQTFNELYSDYKAPINKSIMATRIAVLAYRAMYDRKLAALKRANHGVVTNAMMEELKAELKPYLPMASTYLSDSRLEDGLNYLDTDRTKDVNGKGKPLNPHTDEVLIPVMRDGKVTSKKGSTYSVNITDPGVGSHAINTQALDAANISDIITEGTAPVTGVHDAIITDLLSTFDITKQMNSLFNNIHTSYSMLDSTAEMLDEVLKGGLSNNEMKAIIEDLGEDNILDIFNTTDFSEIQEEMHKEAALRNTLRQIAQEGKYRIVQFNGSSLTVAEIGTGDLTTKQISEFDDLVDDTAAKQEYVVKYFQEYFDYLLDNDKQSKADYVEKDYQKAQLANRFIGSGFAGTSTAMYSKIFSRLGMVKDNFKASDVVFVSANGHMPKKGTSKKKKYSKSKKYGAKSKSNKKTTTTTTNKRKFNVNTHRSVLTSKGKLTQAYAKLAKAVKAGATIIADNQESLDRKYNSGEREIAQYLMQNGYVAVQDKGKQYFRWIPETSVKSTDNVVKVKIKDFKGTNRPTAELTDTLIRGDAKQVVSRIKQLLVGKKTSVTAGVYNLILNTVNTDPQEGIKVLWHNSKEEADAAGVLGLVAKGNFVYNAKNDAIHIFGYKIGKDMTDTELALKVLHEMDHSAFYRRLVKAGIKALPVKYAKALLVQMLVDGEGYKTFTDNLMGTQSAGFLGEVQAIINKITPFTGSRRDAVKLIEGLDDKTLLEFTAELSAWSKTDSTVRNALNTFKNGEDNVDTGKVGLDETYKAVGLAGWVRNFINAIAKFMGFNHKEATFYEAFTASTTHYYARSSTTFNKPRLSQEYYDLAHLLGEDAILGLDDSIPLTEREVTLRTLMMIYESLSGAPADITKLREKAYEHWYGRHSEQAKNIPRSYGANLIANAYDKNGQFKRDSELAILWNYLHYINKDKLIENRFAIPELKDDQHNFLEEFINDLVSSPFNTLSEDDIADLNVESDEYLYHRAAPLFEVDITAENFTSIYDQLGQLQGAYKPSQQHDTQLKRVMDMIAPTLNKVSLLALEGDETYGKTHGNNRVGMSVNLGSKVSQLEMSPQEVLVHELTHPMLWQADKSGKAWRAIEEEIGYIRKHIKPEDFTAHLVNPTEADKAAAQRQYDHVVNNKVDGFTTYTTYLNEQGKVSNSNPTEEVLVFALTNVSMQRAIDRLNQRNPKPAKPEGIYEHLVQMLGSLMRLINRDITPNQSMKRNDRIMYLADMLVDTQRKHQGMFRRAETAVEDIFNTADRWIEKTTDTIGWTDTLKKAKLALEVSPKARADIRKLYGNWVYGKSKFVAEVANELTMGRKSMEDLLMLLTKSSKKVEQDTMNIKEQISRNMAQNLADVTDEQSKSIYYGAAKTDLPALTDRFSAEEIQALLINEDMQNSTIVKIQGELQTAAGKNYHWMRDNAEDLGYYMVTGGRLYANGSHNNPMQIVEMYGLPESYVKNSKMDNDKVERLVDELATMYALRYTPHKLSNRFLVNEGELEYILQNLTQLKELSMDRVFDSKDYNYRKGYIGEEFKTDLDVVIADESEGKRLIAIGYSRGMEALSDPLASGKKQRHYYTKAGSQLTRYQTGIMSLKGDRVRGTELFPVYNVGGKEAYQNSLSQERMIRERLRLNKLMHKQGGTKINNEYRQRIAATRYNSNGQVIKFMQETADHIKDDLLDRDTNYASAMATTIAGIHRKVNTDEINREAINMMHRLYKQQYKNRAHEFIKLDQESETFKILPKSAQYYFRELWGDDPIMVRREQYSVWFGYRKFSIRDMQKHDLADQKGWDKFNAAINNIFYSLLHNKVGIASEEYWLNFVKMAKDTIVIKSLAVTAANITSNVILLWLSGVPLSTAMKDTVEGYKHTIAYKQLQSELYDEQAKLFAPDLSVDDKAKLSANVAVLQHKLANSPVHALMEAGLYQTVVEDVSTLDEDAPIKDKLDKLAEPLTNKLPDGAKKVGSNLLMLHGSKTYQLARDFAQMSDFAARYSLHKHNTTVEGLTFSASVHDCMMTFINYDMPTHRGIQALNDYGLMGFTKYLMRLQQVILKRFGKKPSRMVTLAMLQGLGGVNLPDPTDALLTGPGEVLARVYDPMDWVSGATEIASLNLAGSAIN